MQILYFHGGPGMNSNPERSLLAKNCANLGLSIEFWNEPSKLRPKGPPYREGSFQNYLKQAEAFFLHHSNQKPVVLVGHSFGAYPVAHLAAKFSKQVAKAIFVASDLAVFSADRNMLTHVMKDFESQGDARAEELKEILARFSGRFDENLERGYRVALGNNQVFNSYWRQKDQMASYLAGFSGNEYGIDLDSFLSVRRSLQLMEIENCSVPAIAIYGAHESIVSKENEVAMLRQYFSNLSVLDFQDSAHYPHIEETEKFLKLLWQEAQG